MNAPALILTDRAAQKVRQLRDGEGNQALMLRVYVTGGGCSGFSYGFSLDDAVTNDDKVYEFFGAKLVVDDVSLELLGHRVEILA